ncbi:MAG TPA: hypothetical protein DCR55_04935 [Lentisphaeria bacterium]|nr:hypothetical protein [Lentisphaeria bacterium]
MTELCGRVVEYFDGDKLRPVLITQQIGPKLQATDAKGRRQKIQPKHVAVVHGPCAQSELGGTIRNLMTAVADMVAEIDMDLVWETAVDSETKEWDSESLAREFFGEASAIQNSAMLRVLLKQSAYFRQRGLTFTAQTRQTVEQKRVAERKRAEKTAWEAGAVRWMKLALNSPEAPPLPSSIESLPGKLSALIWQEADELEPLIKRAAGDRTLREAALDLLGMLGKLPPGTDRYLALAGIRETFTPDILAAVEAIEPPTAAGRKDLRECMLVSIDDAETTDIDDAIGISETANGWSITIAIADMTAYITPGSILDDLAMRRHTSIYLPTRTAHMLPSELGCDRASLHADQDRPAIVYRIELTKDGSVEEYEIMSAIVRVNHRLTYDDVASYLAESAESTEPLVQLSHCFNRAALALRDQRLNDGALIVLRPELKFTVVSEEDVSVRVIGADSPARDLVGEFMILANRVSAQFGIDTKTPLVYRIQDRAQGVPQGRVLQYDPANLQSTLRGMNRTCLSVSPREHASLGLPAYTQATSPIRRYSDMLVQRQLASRCQGFSPTHSSEELMSFIGGAEQVEPDLRALEGQSKRYWQIQFLVANFSDEILRVRVLYDVRGGYMVELCDYPIRGLLVSGESFRPDAIVAVRIHRAKARRQELRFKI